MSRARIEVPQLENMVGAGKKKFVRYAEGASLYSLGLHTFQEIAKEANAVYKVKRCVLVNTEKVDEYLENFCECQNSKIHRNTNKSIAEKNVWNGGTEWIAT